MKAFAALVILSIMLTQSLAAAANKANVKETTKKLMSACKTRVGASDEDLKAYANKKIPTTREGLCFLECIFDVTNMMQNGKFSRSGMVKGLQQVLEEDVNVKLIEGLATTCEKQVGEGDSDKCVTAKLLAECIINNSAKLGVSV